MTQPRNSFRLHVRFYSFLSQIWVKMDIVRYPIAAVSSALILHGTPPTHLSLLHFLSPANHTHPSQAHRARMRLAPLASPFPSLPPTGERERRGPSLSRDLAMAAARVACPSGGRAEEEELGPVVCYWATSSVRPGKGSSSLCWAPAGSVSPRSSTHSPAGSRGRASMWTASRCTRSFSRRRGFYRPWHMKRWSSISSSWTRRSASR